MFLRRTTAAALVLGAGLSAAGFLLTSRAVDGHEKELLARESAAAASLVATAVQQEQQALDNTAQRLEGTAEIPSSSALGVAGVALLHRGAGSLEVVDRSGTLLAAVPGPGTGSFSPAWASRVANRLTFTGILRSGAQRVLGMALGFPDGEVLYGELPLGPMTGGASSPPVDRSSPLAAVNYAVYLGTAETPSALVATNTAALPLRGERAAVMLTGGAVASPPVVDAAPGSVPGASDELFMVMTPRRALGGTLDIVLPWVALGTGLLVTLLVAAFLEMSARRRDHALALAAALCASERSLRQLFAGNPQPMWATDLETLRFLDVNETALRRYGYSREEFLSMGVADLTPEEDRDALPETIHRVLTVDPPGSVRHRLGDGRVAEMVLTAHVQDWGGRRAALVCARDVTVERVLEERLLHQARHDPLTGAANRDLFTEQLAEMLGAAPCALLLLDVVGMRTVNGTLGRDGADELLVAVCERITAAAGPAARVARLGGDVFATATAETYGLGAARAWADRVTAALDAPFAVREQSVAVSVRAGLALGAAAVEARELLRRADVALVTAKELTPAVRRHVEVFDVERDRARLEVRVMQGELRDAIANGQLRLVYQPLLDVAGGTITGVEALLRWEHPRRGLLAPGVFLPAAESCGLMPALDAWVVAEACRQARAWRDAGLPEITVSVNICGHDVHTGAALVDLVRSELWRNRLPAHALEVELTESVALHDPEEAETVLGRLRELGVSVALDDFGTGYSMLDRVRDLPLDRVKIDRTFVRRATGEGASLLRAMITMAHSLGLATVAEGVETQRELELLTSWGCDTVQGFLISRPVPAAEIAAMMTVQLIASGVSEGDQATA